MMRSKLLSVLFGTVLLTACASNEPLLLATETPPVGDPVADCITVSHEGIQNELVFSTQNCSSDLESGVYGELYDAFVKASLDCNTGKVAYRVNFAAVGAVHLKYNQVQMLVGDTAYQGKPNALSKTRIKDYSVPAACAEVVNSNSSIAAQPAKVAFSNYAIKSRFYMDKGIYTARAWESFDQRFFHFSMSDEMLTDIRTAFEQAPGTKAEIWAYRRAAKDPTSAELPLAEIISLQQVVEQYLASSGHENDNQATSIGGAT